MFRPTRVAWVALLALFFVTIAATGAVAETNATVEIDSEEPNPEAECTEQIDPVVSLCDSEYSDGQVTLTLYSEATQNVIITDAGAFMRGGEVEQQTFTLDGYSEVSMPVTEYQGYVGVSIDTSRVLYAVPIETGGSISAPKESDILALLTGVALVPAAAVIVKKVRDRKRRKGVLRVDG